MARHSIRGTNGRFSPVGAPIPVGDDHTGADPLAYDGPLRDPNQDYPEFHESYPVREFAHRDGSYSPLRGRRQILVDANTGESLDAHITHVRAVDARSNLGQGSHVVAVEDDGLGGEFSDAQYPTGNRPAYDTMRGYRSTPGSKGRLRSQAVHTDAEPYDTGSDSPLYR
jgi:hypothetical protein